MKTAITKNNPIMPANIQLQIVVMVSSLTKVLSMVDMYSSAFTTIKTPQINIEI